MCIPMTRFPGHSAGTKTHRQGEPLELEETSTVSGGGALGLGGILRNKPEGKLAVPSR
jgi:hypothetical protein